MFAHVLCLPGERYEDHQIVGGHGGHGALKLVAGWDDVTEFAAHLHGFGELLHGVALGVPGAEAVDGAGVVHFFDELRQLHVFEVVVGSQDVFFTALNKPGVVGFGAGEGGFNEVFQLRKA